MAVMFWFPFAEKSFTRVVKNLKIFGRESGRPLRRSNFFCSIGYYQSLWNLNKNELWIDRLLVLLCQWIVGMTLLYPGERKERAQQFRRAAGKMQYIMQSTSTHEWADRRTDIDRNELSKKLMGRSSHFRKNVLSQRRKMLTGTSHKLKQSSSAKSKSTDPLLGHWESSS